MRYTTMTRVTVLLPVLLAVCVVGGCKRDGSNGSNSSSTQPSGGTKVRLRLDWKPEPEFGGFFAAQNGGNFARHGLDVDIATAGEGANIWQLVDRGQIEFGTTAADQVLIARQGGADVVALFAVYQTSPQGIMVHKARGFTSIGDVFTKPGTLAAEPNAWLTFCRRKYGDGPVKITGYSGGVAAFLAKPDYSQQCFVTSEPIQAKRQGSDPQTFLVSDAGYNPYTTVVIAKGEYVRSHPDIVKGLVAACREGWRSYLDDPAPTNAVMGKLNKEMDAQTFTDAAEAQKPLIETDQTKQTGLGSMTRERWQNLAQQLVDLGVIKNAPPAEQCYVDLGVATTGPAGK